jgi:hypothetical protein
MSSSANPAIVTLPSEVRKDKGKGRAQSTLPKEAGHSPHWKGRETPPKMTLPSDAWTQIEDSLKLWGQTAERSSAETLRIQRDRVSFEDQIQRDKVSFNERVDEAYQQASSAADAIKHIGRLEANLKAQYRGRPIPVDTPRAKASRAIYAERGSDE